MKSLRENYRNLLALAMIRRRLFVTGFLAVVLVSFGLAPFLGSNFFPAVDTGQIVLHVRPPIGTRIEDNTQIFARIEDQIRRVIPPDELTSIVDNIGLPNSSINTIYNNSGLIGNQDGDIFISLNDGSHHPTAGYVRTLREKPCRAFSRHGITFSFPPPDIVSQILNFGTPAPIDVQVTGANPEATQAYAQSLLRQIRGVSGAADVRLQQSIDNPQLNFDANRSRMAQVGLTEQNVTSAVATALAGTSQSAPSFWIDPRNGVSYAIVAQTPEYRMDNFADLQNLPVTTATAGVSPQVLGALGSFSRERMAAVVVATAL